jgi:5-methylthioribose kinase
MFLRVSARTSAAAAGTADSRALTFELTPDSAVSWVNEHGLNPENVPLSATELAGGVSASVVAVTGDGVGLVLKQALPRLRVQDVWEASPDRGATEAAALEVLGKLTPGAVPRVLHQEPGDYIVVLELLPASARNWQAEIAGGLVHAGLGTWAGRTLGLWHAQTAGPNGLSAAFDSQETFEALRLAPFHEAVMKRRPPLAGAIAPYLAELRSVRRCLVDGDYAPKNMLVDPNGRCFVLDLEVAHRGNPVFDVGFFLSFVLLSAVRWPSLAAELRELGDRFLAGYEDAAGAGFAGNGASVAGHTACLMLARTDGVSPAAFLDDESLRGAREVGISLLSAPEKGLWSWS